MMVFSVVCFFIELVKRAFSPVKIGMKYSKLLTVSASSFMSTHKVADEWNFELLVSEYSVALSNL